DVEGADGRDDGAAGRADGIEPADGVQPDGRASDVGLLQRVAGCAELWRELVGRGGIQGGELVRAHRRTGLWVDEPERALDPVDAGHRLDGRRVVGEP